MTDAEAIMQLKRWSREARRLNTEARQVRKHAAEALGAAGVSVGYNGLDVPRAYAPSVAFENGEVFCGHYREDGSRGYQSLGGAVEAVSEETAESFRAIEDRIARLRKLAEAAA